MTPRQLNYFIEIARARSFTRASAVLHIAQPALSRQIQQLEENIGVVLFKRTESGVVLTDAGELLHERALALLEHFKRVKDEVASFSQDPSGRLHVGLPPSMFDLVTAPLVRDYQARYPKVSLEVTEGVGSALHEMVLSGRVDVAVVSATASLAGVSRQLMLTEGMYVVGSPQNKWLSQQISIKIGDLAEIPLVLTQRPNTLRRLVDEAFADAGVDCTTLIESSSTRLALALVEVGTACSVLPFCAIAADLETGRLIARPVDTLEVTWAMIYSRDKTLSAAADTFRQMLMETARARRSEGRWAGMLSLAEQG